MAQRIVFMGTPEFAVPALDRLAKDGHSLLVVTQPARPAGRGLTAQPSPVRRAAEALGLPVLERGTLKEASAIAPLADFAPDFLVVVAFGLILRPEVLALPGRMPVNLHPSLLPRHRGVAPIRWTILCGDRETAVTTIRMDLGIDTGDILLVERTLVGPEEDAATLGARLARLGAELVARTVNAAARGALVPAPQPAAGATYAPKLRKEHGHLDWGAPAVVLARQVRAMAGWPGARAEWEGTPIEVLAAEPIANRARERGDESPGTVLGIAPAGIEVATGAGALRLVELRPAGKRAMPAAAFARGRRIHPGARFTSLPGHELLGEALAGAWKTDGN
jgi:methionyl-tRNA formyltransferase